MPGVGGPSWKSIGSGLVRFTHGAFRPGASGSFIKFKRALDPRRSAGSCATLTTLLLDQLPNVGGDSHAILARRTLMRGLVAKGAPAWAPLHQLRHQGGRGALPITGLVCADEHVKPKEENPLELRLIAGQAQLAASAASR